jgi:hypothetical protein
VKVRVVETPKGWFLVQRKSREGLWIDLSVWVKFRDAMQNAQLHSQFEALPAETRREFVDVIHEFSYN